MTKIDHIVLAVHDLEAAANLYAQLGFSLAPKASHPWGTDNVCIQLLDETYIEHLALIRPAEVPEHVNNAFSFGAFNRDFLARREGFSMLAVEGDSPEHDATRFADLGLQVHDPSGMERDQRLPDGTIVRMAFRTQFATDAELHGEATVFGCYKTPKEAFWNPAYQTHENDIVGIDHVCIKTPSEAAAEPLIRAANLPENRVRVAVDTDYQTPEFSGYVIRTAALSGFIKRAADVGIAISTESDVTWLDPERTFGVRIGITQA